MFDEIISVSWPTEFERDLVEASNIAIGVNTPSPELRAQIDAGISQLEAYANDRGNHLQEGK